MIMGASTFPGVMVRGSRTRFATGGRGLGDLMTDCEGPHPNCSPLDQECIANWQNIVSSCQPVPAAAGITRQLSTSSPKFAAQLAAAGGDELLALQAQGNPVLPSHPAAAWWGGPGASVSGNPMPYSSSHHNPGATPTNPIQQQVRINPTNLPVRPLHSRPPLRGGYGQSFYLPPGTVTPGWYSTVPMPAVGLAGLGLVRGAQTTSNGTTTSADGQMTATVRQPIRPVASIMPVQGRIVVSNRPPAIVNPSPTTQLTNTGSSQASPTSVLNQSSGCVQCLVSGPGCCGYTGQVSTVGGTVSGSWFSDPTQDVITGLPNWALLAIAGAGLYMVVNIASKR